MKLQYISILLFFLFFNLLNLHSQSLSLKAGVSISNFYRKDHRPSFIYNLSNEQGYNIGAFFEYPLSNQFSLETGLLFTQKRFSFKGYEEIGGFDLEHNFNGYENLFYVDVPILIKQSFKFGSKKVYCSLGPYISFGLSGDSYNKDILVIKNNNDEELIAEFKYDTWKNNENLIYKKNDFGFMIGTGIELHHFLLSAFYSHGLSNLTVKEKQEFFDTKSRLFGVSLGYKINLKK